MGCLIEAWREQPHRLIGAHCEQTHFKKNASDGSFLELVPDRDVVPNFDAQGNDLGSTVTCSMAWGSQYSMLLPHPWVFKKQYMELYMAGSEMTKLVDDMHNCDDVYFNG